MNNAPAKYMDKSPALQSGGGLDLRTFKDLLGRMKGKVAEAATKYISADRLLALALQAAMKQPKLLQCSTESWILALRECAVLGLEPGMLGEAYLIPYFNKGRMEVQFQIGYKGLIKLAKRSGELRNIAAYAVHERDEFVYEQGTDPRIYHKPTIKGEAGPVIGFYSIAWLKDSEIPHMDFMRVEEIERIRMRSKAKDSGPWQTDWEEMGKKTVTKRNVKYLKMPDLDFQIERDEALERGEIIAPSNAVELPASDVREIEEHEPEVPEEVDEELTAMLGGEAR